MSTDPIRCTTHVLMAGANCFQVHRKNGSTQSNPTNSNLYELA